MFTIKSRGLLFTELTKRLLYEKFVNMLAALCGWILLAGMPVETMAVAPWRLPQATLPALFAQARGQRMEAQSAADNEPVHEWTEDEWEVLETSGYRLKYPKDWRVDAESSGYDLEYHFTIDSSGESQITFEFFEWEPGFETEDILRNTLHAFDGVAIQTMSRSDFNRWGKHEGHGRHLKGKILGIIPGGCRIFVSRSGNRGFLIAEFYHAPELPEAMPGFHLIGQTLELL